MTNLQLSTYTALDRSMLHNYKSTRKPCEITKTDEMPSERITSYTRILQVGQSPNS